jgi:hypothetical protein
MMQEQRTIRQQIIQLLTEETLSARDLSQALRISEREVYGHLAHVAQSVASDQKLVIEPAVCQRCGFLFRKRERWRKPSKCPKCRGEFISGPRFTIQVR